MVSDVVRKEIWHYITNVERNCRYYEDTYTSMFRWHIGIRGATLAAIVVGLLAIPDSLGFSAVIKIVIAAIAAVLTIWEAVANYSKEGSHSRSHSFSTSPHPV